MRAVLVLKCEGHTLDGFTFCTGVSNVILDLEAIEGTEGYVGLVKYLDSVVKVFDKPCVNANVISNALYKLYEMGYADEKAYKYYGFFWGQHKGCGLILEVVVKDD